MKAPSEAKRGAEQMLAGHIHCYGDGGVEDAERILETSPKPSRWIRWSCYLIVLIISAIVLVSQATQVYSNQNVLTGLTGMFYGVDPKLDNHQYSRHERLVLYGDYQAALPHNRMYALWQSEPNNPAYFYAYISEYLDNYSVTEMPKSYQQDWQQIDANNGWYPMIEAGLIADEAVERNYSSSSKAAQPYTLLDQAKFEQSLALFYQAAGAKHIRSHQEELLRERIRYLPQGNDSITRLQPVAYLTAQPTPHFQLTKLSRVISVEAERCKKEKDRKALEKLIPAWRRVGEELTHDSLTLVDALIAKVWFHGNTKILSEAARECGMDTEADQLEKMHKVLEADKARKKAHHNPEEERLFEQKSGILHNFATSLSYRQVRNPQPLTEGSLLPGKMTDHAFSGRFFSFTGWFIMAILVAGNWLVRYRNPKPVSPITEPLMRVLRPADWLWILGVGLVLPVLYYQLIQHFTPLSAREFSVYFTTLSMPAAQFTGMVFLVIVALPTVCRFRLGKRLPAVGSRISALHWGALASAALSIPAAGIPPWIPEQMEMLLYGVASVLAIPLLIFLWWLFLGVFQNGENILSRAIVQRAMVPSYAIAALLLVLWIPVYQAEEAHWISQDQILKISEETPGVNAFEYHLTQQAKKEILEMIDVD